MLVERFLRESTPSEALRPWGGHRPGISTQPRSVYGERFWRALFRTHHMFHKPEGQVTTALMHPRRLYTRVQES
jgi:hypothetical protein